MKSHSLTRRLLVGLLLTSVAATASAQMTINGPGATLPVSDILEMVRRLRQGREDIRHPSNLMEVG